MWPRRWTIVGDVVIDDKGDSNVFVAKVFSPKILSIEKFNEDDLVEWVIDCFWETIRIEIEVNQWNENCTWLKRFSYCIDWFVNRF